MITVEQIKITLPRTHPSINEWTKWHWTKIHKVKKSFENDIGWLAGKYGQPKLSNCDVKIIYTFSTNRKRDKDNYTPKFIMDGLVKSEIISDDNTDEVYLNWVIKQGSEEQTEIIVTPRET